MKMITLKYILILSFLSIISFHSFGQKIKYRNFKNDFSLENYREKINDEKYSPFVAGVCNYLFPSAGYLYVGEPLRGACVFGSHMVASSAFVAGLIMSMGINYETGSSPKGGRIIMFSGIIASGFIQIYSIYDVVRIAKIKNLAFQENKITLDLKPDLFQLSHSENNSAVYGLKQSIHF